jgi:hypothetical protein
LSTGAVTGASARAKPLCNTAMVEYERRKCIGTRRTGSDGKRKKSNDTWTEGMMTGETATIGYMVCVNNEGYPASLELGKLYEVLQDDNAEPDEIRVVDESGEDYIYPVDYFASEAETLSEIPELYEDVTREIRGFIRENEPLLKDASPLVLGQIFTQGVRIFTTINEEVVEGSNRAAAAKRELAEAITDPATLPSRLGELEAEEARVSRINAARTAASKELDDFLYRVQGLLHDTKD